MSIITKILIVAAHPDDEILMCGGTAKRFSNEGAEIKTLILGEGITSRDNYTQEEDVERLHAQAKEANELIGSQVLHIHDFPDNRFDSVNLLDIVKVVSKYKDDFTPDTIITHYRNDLNIDHRKTYEAVLTATRPMQNETVKTIYCGEVLSSTEWQLPNTFVPNTYFNIEKFIEKKITALKIYHNELKEYPHPRSILGIECRAMWHGITVGGGQYEAFDCVRNII